MEAQRRVAAAARDCAIPLETRPYRPHVTLGRVRSGRGRAALLAALQKGQWWLVFLIVLSSLLAAAYVWRFVEAAYFREPRRDTAGGATVPWSMALPAAMLVAATVYFGLDTSFTVGSAAQAAAGLLGGPR